MGTIDVSRVRCTYLTPHSLLGISSASPTPALTRHWQSKKGETALSMAKNDETRALLKAAAALKLPETYYGSRRQDLFLNSLQKE